MDVAAVLIGVVLMAIVFLVEELWMRMEPADPPHPDSTTNAFLEKRYRYECPCGKTMVTCDPYVLSYRCLSCQSTRFIHAIKLVLTRLGFVKPQSDHGQNTATTAAVTIGAIKSTRRY